MPALVVALANVLYLVIGETHSAVRKAEDDAIHLTSWQATPFLVGEYEGAELHGSPVFTLADGILALSKTGARNSAVCKLQVPK